MVFLSRLLAVMPKARIKWYTYEQICRGRHAIKDILPLTKMNIKKVRKSKAKPAPGFKRTMFSAVLGRSLRIRATLGTQRAIEHAGGFDRYIYYTPEEKFKSQLALSLKKRMEERIAEHPHTLPPPLDKRNPKPVSKHLSKGLKPVEVCNMTKYVYLG